ncbi:MAG: ribosome-associated translation inhibitor RaiA [Acidobacteriaceae bacterium]|nr:ribosome-associated translation inhibitor RaiA [Acidobacteriaceae bacterium]MBV8570002.1 ribosome-associated translation inhibitor RaiA [Acidobacteriaceae bacterium]
MKLIVSGKTKDFTPELQEKFGAKLAKLSKFIERRGEREAHVVHQMERHLHKVEVIVNFYDHALVAQAADSDLDTALCQAVVNLEKQVMKLRNRWRDSHRDMKAVRSMKENGLPEIAAPLEEEPAIKRAVNGRSNPARAAKRRIFHVNYTEDRKPMTLEEAVLEMEREVDYVVYQDSDRQCLSVLVRRRDGNYDLIQS